jgi:cell division protein FtsI (penicillin-binding protein 3)
VIYHQSIRDHEPYGKLTFTQALAYSSNVCFAKIATAVGAGRLFRFTRNFGFGERTGIELPGEEAGILHPVRTWSGRTLVTMAIGQELSVTLLQMMAAYAAVANGGVMVKPWICDRIVTCDGTTIERLLRGRSGA